MVVKKTAFTLVELLVVIAIIGILIALLLPAINAAREAGRRAQCMNNCKQLGLAAINYQESLEKFPLGVMLPKGQDPASTYQWGANWVIQILPYTENPQLAKIFYPLKPLSDPANAVLRATRIPTMLCPSDALNNSKPYMPVVRSFEGANWARGNYAANGSLEQFELWGSSNINFVGPGSTGWAIPWLRGVMGVNESSAMRQITDGASHTCLLGEIRTGVAPMDRRGTWAMGCAGASLMWGHGATDDHGPNNNSELADDIIECDEIEQTISSDTLTQMFMGCYGGGGNNQATARSMHPGGAHICMCDGAVVFISDSINVSTTWSYTTTTRVASEFGIWEQLMSAGDSLAIPNNTW
jgi:prepilin-type N-terminal cleavage/methylation domain-containing protein/prepilin-type processing-associated H-X9-DG protein